MPIYSPIHVRAQLCCKGCGTRIEVDLPIVVSCDVGAPMLNLGPDRAQLLEALPKGWILYTEYGVDGVSLYCPSCH